MSQIPGVTLEQGDTIDHLSVSDAATAWITRKRHQIFICTNHTVLRCERYNTYNLFIFYFRKLLLHVQCIFYMLYFFSLFSCLLFSRYNFPDSLSVTQFVVCASLGELEHKKKKKGASDHETDSGSGLKIALLDSEHKV